MSLIDGLPGASAFKSKHYSGYLRISDTKRIFFYFVESENNPLEDNTIFWISNGGPGKSMISLSTYYIIIIIIYELIIYELIRLFWIIGCVCSKRTFSNNE
jgi:hypothetical protein